MDGDNIRYAALECGAYVAGAMQHIKPLPAGEPGKDRVFPEYSKES